MNCKKTPATAQWCILLRWLFFRVYNFINSSLPHSYHQLYQQNISNITIPKNPIQSWKTPGYAEHILKLQ
jgi:hypothetical protein